MANNNNGFADALNRLNTLIDVGTTVQINVLEEAAEYFAKKLRENIKLGSGNVHLKDEIKVVIHKDYVSVQFSDKAWYWHLYENGHKKPNGKGRVKGSHVVRNTIDKENNAISKMLISKIIKKMEGKR